jgi:hypothetical protein
VALYSEKVPLRLVALMLAIVMIGVVPQVVHAGSELPIEVVEVMSESDELGDSTTVEPVIVTWPDLGSGAGDVSRAHRRGRAHTTLVFRPPRWFASR